MSLKVRLKEQQILAMRAKDKVRLGTLRMLLAAIKQIEIDERIEALEKKIMSQKYEAKCKRYGWNPKEDIHL